MIVRGCKVYWTHHNNNGIKQRSSTECYIVLMENNSIIATGLAKANKGVNYDKNVGRKVSFEDALTRIRDKTFRKVLWEKLKETSPKTFNAKP